MLVALGQHTLKYALFYGVSYLLNNKDTIIDTTIFGLLRLTWVRQQRNWTMEDWRNVV